MKSIKIVTKFNIFSKLLHNSIIITKNSRYAFDTPVATKLIFYSKTN